jgi:hypothetical protein
VKKTGVKESWVTISLSGFNYTHKKFDIPFHAWVGTLLLTNSWTQALCVFFIVKQKEQSS